MDSWEFTKIAAAVLAALLIMMGTKTAIEIAQSAHSDKVVGYKLPVKEVAAADAGKAAAPAAPSVPFEKVVPLMQAASAERGAVVFKQCTQCHTPGKGGANGTGPNLWGIVDRAKASVAGFNYSEAAKAKAAEKWDWKALVGFINAPAGNMPGTKMAFKGIDDTDKMADLMAYLATLADTPVPLPK